MFFIYIFLHIFVCISCTTFIINKMCNYFLAITNLQSNIVMFVTWLQTQTTKTKRICIVVVVSILLGIQEKNKKPSCRRETARRFESMKSLKIIGNDTLENDVSPLVFCCNYVSRTVVPFLSETFSVK